MMVDMFYYKLIVLLHLKKKYFHEIVMSTKNDMERICIKKNKMDCNVYLLSEVFTSSDLFFKHVNTFKNHINKINLKDLLNTNNKNIKNYISDRKRIFNILYPKLKINDCIYRQLSEYSVIADLLNIKFPNSIYVGSDSFYTNYGITLISKNLTYLYFSMKEEKL